MLSLAKKKASVEFDQDAKKLRDEIATSLKVINNFGDLMKNYEGNDQVGFEVVEDVDYSNLDSGRAAAAAKLQNVGDMTDFFVSKNGDGYYIVKLLNKTDTKVSYASIWVRFKWVDDQMAKLRQDGKVVEKIDLTAKDSSEEETASEENSTEEEK